MAVHARPRPTSLPRGAHPRARVLAALLVDLGTLVASLAFGVAIALAYLLTRTSRGLLDVSPGDGILGLAVCAAALPTWAALEWRSLLMTGGTLGSRALHASIDPLPRRGFARWLTLALHPSAAVAWLWLGLGLALPSWYLASGVALGVALAVFALAVATLVVQLVWPEATSVHGRIMRLLTRLLAGRRA